MADAEKKKIAELYFGYNNSAFNNINKDVENANKKVDTLIDKLESISKVKISTDLSKNINVSDAVKNVKTMNSTILSEDKVLNRKLILQNNDYENKRKLADQKAANEIIQNNQKVEQSTQTMFDKISTYAQTYVLYQGFNLLKQAISDTIDEMVELEYQMVAIDRVLNEDTLNIDSYRDELNQIAYDYGNSMDNVTDIALRLAQAGFNSNEVLELTKSTLLALNTAELDATQATSDMVAVMAQWGLRTGDVTQEAKDFAQIIDEINIVADNFPTTSEDIMDALKKTSSAFNLAGASIEETIATITAAEVASQRGGKVIGTALSNITQQLKDEGKISIAESLGISFYTDETKTEFKNIIKIFESLADKMQELKNAGKESSTEMQTLLSVFTVFRRNIGSSLLSEMGGEISEYDKIMKTLSESTGYSLQENEKYMKTAKAAQEQFNSTLLQLKTEVWDNGVEGVYRELLEKGEGFVQWLIKLQKSGKLIPTLMATIAASFGLFSKKMNAEGVKKYTTQLKATWKALKDFSSQEKLAAEVTAEFEKTTGQKMPESLKKVGTASKSAATGLTTYAAKTVAAKVGQIALNVAIAAGEAALTFGLSLALQAVITAFQNWINATEKAVENLEEANSKLNEQQSSLKSYSNQVEELRKEMESGELTQSEYNDRAKELKEIQEELVKTYGDSAKGIDLINGKLEDQIDLIDELGKKNWKEYIQSNTTDINKIIKESTETKNKAIVPAGNEELMWSSAGSDKFKKGALASEITKQMTEEIEGMNVNWAGLIFANGTAEEMIYQYSQLFDKLDERIASEQDETLKTALQHEQELVSTALKELHNEYDDALEQYQEYLANRLQYSEYYEEEYAKILAAKSKVSKSETPEEEFSALESLKTAYQNALDKAKDDPTVSEGMMELIQEKIDEVNDEISGKNFEIAMETDFEWLKGEKTLKEEIQDTIDGLDKDDIDFRNIEQIFTAVNSGFDIGENTKGIKELSELLSTAGISAEEFKNHLDEFNLSLEETEVKASEVKEIMSGMVTSMTSLQTQYTTLTSAQNELNNTGGITVSTFKSIIENGLLDYLDVQNGKIIVNTASLENLAEQTKVNAILSLQDAAAKDLENLAMGNTSSLSSTAKNALAGLENKENTLSTQSTTTTQAIANMNSELVKTAKILSETTDDEEYTKKANAIIAAYNTAAKKIQTVTLSTSTSGNKNSGSKSNKDDDKEKEAEEKYKKRLSAFKETLDEMEDEEEAWVKKQKELGLLSNQDMMYVTKQRITRYNNYLKQIKKATWLSADDRKELIEKYTKEIKELELDYFDYYSDLVKEQIEELEDARDKEIKDLQEANKEKIKLIEEKADAEIAALKKVQDEVDREREKEEYKSERKGILDEISYWSQRTGKEAKEALAEAKKSLEELDKEWKEKQEDWDIADKIEAIEKERDRQIADIEATEETDIASIEKRYQTEIDEIQKAYDYKVKVFSESDKIIYDNSVISSKNLYNAYKTNFVDKLNADIKNLNKTSSNSNSSSGQYENYKIKSGDTLSAIAKKYNTTVKKIMSANPSIKDANKIYAGKTIKIPKFHEGGIVGGNQEAFALLKPNEVVLKTEWAASLNRMMKYFDKLSSEGTMMASGTNIQVTGDLVRIDANIKDKTDAEYFTRKVEKMLKDKFNIKK